MTTFQRGAVSTPLIIAGVVIALLVVGGGYYFSQQSESVNELDAMMDDDDAMMEKDSMMEDDEHGDTMMEDDKDAMMEEGEVMSDSSYSGQVLAGDEAPLLVFNQADYDKAVSEGKLVTLYFYANWCPICRAEFPKMEAAFNQLSSDEVVGFRVNFNDNETDDDEVALARKYGVPYQHTKVFVKNGEQVLKSPEEWDTQRYLNEINNAL